MIDLRTLRHVAAVYEHEFRDIDTARALRRVADRLELKAESNGFVQRGTERPPGEHDKHCRWEEREPVWVCSPWCDA